MYIPSSLDVGRLPTVMAEDDPREVELLFCLSLDEEDWDCPVELKDDEESSGEFFDDFFLFPFPVVLAPDEE